MKSSSCEVAFLNAKLNSITILEQKQVQRWEKQKFRDVKQSNSCFSCLLRLILLGIILKHWSSPVRLRVVRYLQNLSPHMNFSAWFEQIEFCAQSSAENAERPQTNFAVVTSHLFGSLYMFWRSLSGETVHCFLRNQERNQSSLVTLK